MFGSLLSNRRAKVTSQRFMTRTQHRELPRAVTRVLAVGGAVVAALVAAQTATAQTAPSQQTEQLSTVIVTGSRIQRTDTETPSPVQILTSEDLKKFGYTNTQAVLKNLTANGQGTLSQSFSGAFASGATGIGVRALKVGYTLVLIDGHRMAPFPIGDDGQRSFVDVANTAFGAIERIEVLKDGASAVYGSDARAATATSIPKRPYQSSGGTADGGLSSHGDG